MTLTEFANKLSSANLDTNDLAGVVLEERSNEATDLNRQQLLSGKKKDGSGMGTYRPFTVQERLRRGLQVQFVDLRFTGNWQGGLKFVRKGTTYDFESSDWKDGMLRDKYGETITGLSDDSKDEFMRSWGRRDLVHEISMRTGIGVK